MRTRSSRALSAAADENAAPLEADGAKEVACTPMSKKDMLAQWKKSNGNGNGSASVARTPLGRRDAVNGAAAPPSATAASGLKAKVAWMDGSEHASAGGFLTTPARQQQQQSATATAGPSIDDLKARVDVIRRESVMRDVRRESAIGLATPGGGVSGGIPMTPNNRGLVGKSSELSQSVMGELPSCLGAAVACFDEAQFVKECKLALSYKIRASRKEPEQQRDEAVTIIKSLRKCMKHMFSKKEALSKAATQYEEEVAGLISSIKLQSEAENSSLRTQTLMQTKELFKEIKGEAGSGEQELHFQQRMDKLEKLEAHLQSCERSLESERASVRDEESKRAMAEAQAQLNHSLSEVEKRQSQLKKAEAELKERRLEWQAMEQEFKALAEEAEKEKQETKQIEEQSCFLQKRCTSLVTDLV